MPKRTFHVLYLPHGPISGCIDAIRVLANPAEKHRAHITVRGPYLSHSKRSDVASRSVESSEINVSGSGNFFEAGQNTVYLKCASPNLEAVWYKPDYDFNPHITLYDGPSPDFARKLWHIVSSRPYEFSFVAGPLSRLVSTRGRQGGMAALQADLDSRLLRDVASLETHQVNIESLGQEVRLQAIGKLCDYLSAIESHTSLQPRQVNPDDAPTFEIVGIDPDSPHLSDIKTLAKKNSSTLGFLPDGAFNDYAQRGWILAAIESGRVAGYLVYRVSRMVAVLVQLCTEESYREQGVARKLFRSVVERTSELRGVLANTRRDFPAHTLWPRLGFTAIGERAGRGMKGNVLSKWWYEHSHPTLFSNMALSANAQEPIDVAIDLNVFYDLVTPAFREGADESRSLQSDWLTDEIRLCVTGELFNEINRLRDSQVRTTQRSQAHEFKRISGTAEDFDKMYSLLLSIMGEPVSNRQSSDLRHLAHAAAADVEYFVTRDLDIIRYGTEIESKAGVTPLRPADLVVALDQVRNAASYQPSRLRGSTLMIKKVERRQRQTLEDSFLSKSLGETKAAFRKMLSAILPSSPKVSLSVLQGEDGEPLVLFGIKWSRQDVFEVPCLRFRQGRMARTLARQIVSMVIDSAIANSSPLIAVTDEWLEAHTEEALAESGFFKVGAQWLKLNYSAVGTEEEISHGLADLLSQARHSGFALPRNPSLPLQPGSQLKAMDTLLLERNLRPLKLINGSLSTIIIPVKPAWAQHLFDPGLAEQTLFGGRPDLLLNWENVYYRSPRSLGDISEPFRILWYVSQDRRYTGTGRIRAYSVGSSIELLPARQAFSRYKRLGIYNQRQVFEIASGDPDGEVMAIRFRDIETFKNPIDRNRLSTLLEHSDSGRPSLRGPQRISERAFAQIYREGKS